MTRPLFGRHAVPVALVLGATVWYGCSDQPTESVTGPAVRFQTPQADIATALDVQRRHTNALLRVPGIVGTAVGLTASGDATLRVFLGSDGAPVPNELDGVAVTTTVTGPFYVLADPTTRQRPAPVGFSVGHPAITAGSIGARVLDVFGNVYVLSNNHVLANQNDASIGDAALQPGPFDGGTAADQIATLSDFEPIVFTGSANNTMDAAVAISNTDDLGFATPADDGYGAPNATIFGDGNGDGLFDNIGDLLGVNVQKYGRTTSLTAGTITGVNAVVTVCYEGQFFCTKSARFVNQLIVGQSGFSGGGDSGSLIVTNDGNNSPVGLLFAGSASQTIANRIDLVLERFGVTVDDGDSGPPDPLTDIAITDVSGPATVDGGTTADVVVTVRNMGNQDVAGAFNVGLDDATDGVNIGTQSVGGLVAGATATLTFPWNTSGSSFGAHTLNASHDLADDNTTNDLGSTTVIVNDPSAGGMHVGDLDVVLSARQFFSWYTVVEVQVHDGNDNPLNGATVVGRWSRSGPFASNTCTTGEGGGNGTCIYLNWGLPGSVRSVSFTVLSVTKAGETYEPSQNHDPDGSSNGTTIIARRP